jgi:microtubule-associated protein-like 1/2
VEGTEQIECIQYSPNGQYLACGSRDNSIYIYAVTDQGYKYSRIGRCYGHSSFITHIDWSVDSEFLMSNSGDYELLVWQAATCKQVTQVPQIRELTFHTNNCTISFNTLGMTSSSQLCLVLFNSYLKLKIFLRHMECDGCCSVG